MKTFIIIILFSITILFTGCNKSEESKLIENYEAWVIRVEQLYSNPKTGEIDTGTMIVIGIDVISEGIKLTSQIEEAHLNQKISDNDYRRYKNLEERVGKIINR